MASHDQSYQAGQVKGRTEEKTERATGAARDKAGAAKDKVYETTQAAKDKTKEGKDQSGSYVSDKAGAAKQKASGATEAAKDKASQAAEQVKSMAQRAKETVEHTFGMGGDDHDRDVPPRYT